MYKEDRLLLTPPQEGDSRSFAGFAWWPTYFIRESNGIRTKHFFWLNHYKVVERYRKLYCWKIGHRTFYEWYHYAWCIESVTPISKQEYKENKL